MKKRPPVNRRSAARAKILVAALGVAVGWGAASSVPSDSTLGETWRFRLEAFGLFSSSASEREEERLLSYLDASGRRVSCDGASVPRFETAPAFVAESTELLANDAPSEPRPNGATFDETEPESSPVAFANPVDEPPAPLEPPADWLVADENANERDRWSRELRLEAFPEPTFAELAAPTWRDDVLVAAATADELRALEFEPGVVPSSLVSSALRRRTANAPLLSGDYSFAETSNASDANAPSTPVVSTPTPTAAPVPTRVGAFTACETFDANGDAKVRVQ